ncbi:hypothetical protein Avbf_16835 [Armadillidium vulgare]|nr:hypothetical protein Avbf_16835 [Armadillidium vulgare]
MSFHRLASHFHDQDPQFIMKLRFLQGIKLRAENETTKLSKIYKEEASKFRGVPLPSFDKIKSTLRKRRAASLIQNMALTPSSISNEKTIKERLMVATHYIARKGMEVVEGPKRFSKIYIDDQGYCYLINRKKDDGSLILRLYSLTIYSLIK